MYLSFHGFSFDLFGLSRRETPLSARDTSQPRTSVVTSDRTTTRPEPEAESAPEVSFRGLCIFPIL
ncbi:MAG TPA: hypothetical protein DDW73_03740 [Rhizobium sp.]|jgi:hypothetical protein|nr:hypothetical protein [Rhizobium sp.]